MLCFRWLDITVCGVMVNQVRFLAFIASMVSLLVASAVKAETGREAGEELNHEENPTLLPVHPSTLPLPPLLSNVDQPATTLNEWMTQIAQATVRVMEVRVMATESGLNVVLDASVPLETPTTSVVGNALIVEILVD